MIGKVIFIDEDNTGLAPLAAALFRKKAAQHSVSIASDSRGTVVLFPEPVNRKVAHIALKYGVYISDHQAVQLGEDDFTPDVLMLALDSSSQKRAFDIHSGFSNIFILKEYVGESGDVRIPLGESEDKYEAVCETVERLMEHLIEKMIDEEAIS